MKNTKKFKLKQLAVYGGIVSVLGAAGAGIAVGIANNTEQTLLLKGQKEYDRWSDAYASDDVLKGKTEFHPAYKKDASSGKYALSDEYDALAMAPTFRVSKAAHIDPENTGLYVTNGFRVETGDLNEYDAVATDGQKHHFDHNFTKLFGYAKGNLDFIPEMNKLLANQTSSLLLTKGIRFRVDTSDAPFYSDMENNSGLGVGTNTLSTVGMVSVAFAFKTILLNFAEKFSSTTDSAPINKLANKIASSIPTGFSQQNVLHSFIASKKTDIEQWTATKFTLPGTTKEITFEDYLKKAVLYQTVNLIITKMYENAISQNIDTIRKFSGDNIPDALANTYKGLETINGKYLYAPNSEGMMGPKEGIDAIKGLLKFENAGGAGKAYDYLDVKTFNNVFSSASSSKRWIVDGGKFKKSDNQFSDFPEYTSENKFLFGWRNQYDRTFIKQKSLSLTPQIKNVNSESLLSDPSSAQKTVMTNIIDAIKTAAQFQIDNKDDEKIKATDKWTNAITLISAVFDGPIESRPSLKEMTEIKYDESTNKISADLNVPSKVYFQTLFNDLHDGVTGDDNYNELTKTLTKFDTPLMWHASASQEATNIKPTKEVLKDIDGKEIKDSDITLSFINKDNVKILADKAKSYMYSGSTLKSSIFGTADNYQRAEKKLIKNLIENQGDENQLSEDSSFEEGSYFDLGDNGDIKTNTDGSLKMNALTPGGFMDNVFAFSGSSVLKNLLTLATFKLPSAEDYNYSVQYLDDLNKYQTSGKNIIDPSTGNFTQSFQDDAYGFLKFLNKENEDVVTGVTTNSDQASSNISGYQIVGLVPDGTVIDKIKIGEHELGAKMVPNVGGVLEGPGMDPTASHKFTKDMWISNIFNVGNIEGSILMAPKSTGKNEFQAKLEIFKHDGTKFISQQKQFDRVWNVDKNYFAAVEMPYAITSNAGDLYLSVFDNRKGV